MTDAAVAGPSIGGAAIARGDRADTIHALASGPPPAGVAVIRVSGPRVQGIVRDWIGRDLPPRRATLVHLTDREDARLDDALALLFAAPASFTGEDVLELHLHGGPAVIAATLRRLDALGSRRAEPGEFTMRAFLNGRVDLIEAERLGDLIEAETEAQRAFAASDRGARNLELYRSWRKALIDARALLEASLDFADEEDAPEDVAHEVSDALEKIAEAIDTHLAGARASEIVRRGYRVALAGPPNAGKSSLLNALAEREVAIVTPVPGTTRDALDVVLDCDGYRVVLTDTAGLRETDDEVEQIGIDRTRRTMERAHCVLWLDPVDGTSVEPPARPTVLRVATKIDLLSGEETLVGDLAVSAVTGEGLSELGTKLGALASSASRTERAVPVSERHERHLRAVCDHLTKARDERVRAEIAAEEIAGAALELGRIVGATDIEEVYGAIFSRFCMGK